MIAQETTTSDNSLEVNVKVKDMDRDDEIGGHTDHDIDIWDMEDGLEEEEKTIDGFIDGSDATRTMYVGFMASGLALLLLTIPVITYNENKFLNLTKAYDVVEEKLFIAENGQTHKENDNKLVFAQGPLSFADAAKDDLLGF